jgi:hypothetical protein
VEFHFLQTDDGSPSLKLGSDAEAMHSSKGAFAETVYIYGHAVTTAVGKGFSPTFLSLGLGLGYNELLTTSLLLKNSVDFSKVRGESFELVDELTENFKAWLTNRELNKDFQKAYDQICSLCSEHSGQEQTSIKSALRKLVENENWKLQGALTAQTNLPQKISCFLFDAFSSKTSPELWSEDFLSSFLNTCAAPQTILATYAATGTLKRALLKNGFEVQVRPGFAGKRESTFAIREGKK